MAGDAATTHLSAENPKGSRNYFAVAPAFAFAIFLLASPLPAD
ncbi:MAG: hypothetical protein ACI9XZ_001955, partial [Alphaproteobacteria bacterium]